MKSNVIQDLGMIGIKPNGIKYRKLLVECEDCGKQWELQRDNWTTRKSNKCQSCGSSFRTHGKSKGNPLYIRWIGMNQRCSDKYTKKGYENVYVCEEWKDYTKFEEWALSNGYAPGLELDKDKICIEQNISPKYYGPDTCTWLTMKENKALMENYLGKKFYTEPTCGIRKKKLKNGNISFCLSHKGKVIGTKHSMKEAIEFKKQYIKENQHGKEEKTTYQT